MKVFKMLVVSVLISFMACSEMLRCVFCFLTRQSVPQDRALSFWLKLIGKVNVA